MTLKEQIKEYAIREANRRAPLLAEASCSATCIFDYCMDIFEEGRRIGKEEVRAEWHGPADLIKILGEVK